MASVDGEGENPLLFSIAKVAFFGVLGCVCGGAPGPRPQAQARRGMPTKSGVGVTKLGPQVDSEV